MKENDYLCAQKSNISALTMDIKGKIKEHGKTQVEIATALGMTRANFCMQIANLENNLAVNLLQNIAKELGISVSELIDDKADAPKDITLSIGGQQITYKREDK